MKIIQANKFFFIKGGAERYMFDLSDWLRTHGQEVVPFTMVHERNLPTQYASFFPSFVQTSQPKFSLSGIKTVGRMFYSLEARRKMASLIAAEKPDLCHIHNIYTQLSPSILHTLTDQKVPVVMTVHDHHLISPQYNLWADECGTNYQHAGIVNGTLSRFHKNSYAASFAQMAAYKFHKLLDIYRKGIASFIVPSSYMKNQLIQAGFAREKIRVIPYGIDVNTVQPRFDNDGYMLFVGRLSEEKGVEMVLRLARMIPDIQFKIVGRGPDEARLHAIGHSLKNVEFVGFKLGEELKELFRGAKAVLLPSRVHEVFPLTALEAMAAGKPVIGSHVGGMSEMIEDRANGFLVQPTDLHAWVEAVMRLSYDDALCKRMSKAARLTIEDRFTARKHFTEVMRVYDYIVN
mgnify:CR=1 FL=1